MANSSWWKDKAENGTHSGESKNFDGNVNKSDLGDVLWTGEKHDHMGTDTGNIQTDTQTWVQVYTGTSYDGRTATIGPNSDINMEDLYDDDGTGNMDDAIMSFKQFDYSPGFATSGVTEYFRMQYPIASSDSDKISYYSQDAEYEVYDPTYTNLGSGKYRIDFFMKHHQMETDDQAAISVTMDGTGKYQDTISVTYTMGDATQIPDWAITLIDDAIDVASKAAIIVLDSAEEVATEGVATVALVEEDEMIEDIAKGLTFVVDHMNAVLSAVFKFQDDGGTTYFPAAVSHALTRIANAYYMELMGPDPATSDMMAFSDAGFFDSLGLSNHWDTDITKENPYRDVSSDSYSYRIYQPENTFFYAHGGAISSLKLDSDNSPLSKDDHMVLQMSFDPQGRPFSVIGTYDIFGFTYPDGVTAPSSSLIMFDSNRNIIHVDRDGNTETLDHSSLGGAFNEVMDGVVTDYETNYSLTFTDQQTNLIEVAWNVINATEAAIG